jgi:hypothetical protein
LGSKAKGGKVVKKAIELGPFLLLIIGTLGLLTNEFVFDWGKIATLIFAAANMIGLLTLGIAYWTRKEGK